MQGSLDLGFRQFEGLPSATQRGDNWFLFLVVVTLFLWIVCIVLILSLPCRISPKGLLTKVSRVSANLPHSHEFVLAPLFLVSEWLQFGAGHAVTDHAIC